MFQQQQSDVVASVSPPSPSSSSPSSLSGQLTAAAAAAFSTLPEATADVPSLGGCLAVFVLSRQSIWAALAQFGAFVNLFNLLPLWHLDGGRAFRTLNRSQRWLAVAAIAAAWAVTNEGLLLLLLIGGSVRTITDKASDRPDAGVLGQYALLVWILAGLSQLPVRLQN